MMRHKNPRSIPGRGGRRPKGSGSYEEALTLRLTPGLRAHLVQRARMMGQAVSEVVRTAIEDWLGAGPRY